MKKIFNILATALLAMGAAACADPAIGPYYVPENAVAPKLSAIDAEYTMVEGDTMTTFKFTAADWGVATGTSYKLYACLSGNGFEKSYSLGTATSASDGIMVLDKDMNNVLISLGCEVGVATAIDFEVVATMVGTEQTSYKLTSNTVTSNLAAYNAEKEYKMVYVLGTFNEWNHKVALHLFNYAEDDVVYSGAVDFGEDHSATAFKITGEPDWDNDSGNWGAETATADVDPATIQLLNASNNDITNYTGHRYYSFSLNKSSLLLTCNLGFDKVGVIGLNADWDNDVVMTYSTYKQRFYADVDIAAATVFKFRVDGAWTYNWGGDKNAMKVGGDKIPIDAGKYRIYLDLNNFSAPTCTVSESAYGTVEGGDPEEPKPEKPENLWSVIGNFAGDSWSVDNYMTQNGDVWTSEPLNMGDTTGFKIRFNNSWADADVTGSAAEDGAVTVGTAMAVAHPGKDFKMTSNGVFVVSYDTKAETVTVTSMSDKWSVIGNVSGSSWDKDFYMTQDGDVWTSAALTFKAGGQFKVRYNNSWADADVIGNAIENDTVVVGQVIKGARPGKNFTIRDAGDYIIICDTKAETVTVTTALPSDTWSLIGIGGDWDNDRFMTETTPGVWTSPAVTINAGDGFKVRFNHGWDVNRGAPGDVEPYALASVGVSVAATPGGKNLTVAETGTYTVVYDSNRELIFLAGWGVIGEVNGDSWGKDFFMTKSAEGVWTSAPVNITGQFKIRYNCAWENGDKGGTNDPETLTPLTAVTAVAGGKNLAVPEAGCYRVVYDENANTLMVQSCFWSVVGIIETSNWDADSFMVETEAGKWNTISPVLANGNFKIRYKCAWDDNRGEDADATYVVTLGSPFKVVKGGKDIAVEKTGALYNVAYDKTAETITVTAAE